MQRQIWKRLESVSQAIANRHIQYPFIFLQSGAPLHDDNSNGADAFRYMAVIADQMKNEEVVIRDPYRGYGGGYAA